MQHPKDVLEQEYREELSIVTITKQGVATQRAMDLNRRVAIYQEIEKRSGVRALWLMGINERESGGNVRCYLGNGQSLKHRTTIVPKGRGPFLDDMPEDFIKGALDSLEVDHIPVMKTWEDMCYYGELWNGFGPRARGIRTGYLWGGTSLQQRGKYVADHMWDSSVMDTQLGLVAIWRALITVNPSLNFADYGAVPIVENAPSVIPVLHEDTEWVQTRLNGLGLGPLVVDNNYGRRTANAVRAFQKLNKIDADGIAGPITKKLLENAVTQ